MADAVGDIQAKVAARMRGSDVVEPVVFSDPHAGLSDAGEALERLTSTKPVPAAVEAPQAPEVRREPVVEVESDYVPDGPPLSAYEEPHEDRRGGDMSEPEPAKWCRPGGTWLFEEYVERPAIWGRDDEILWPDDESLVIAAPTGVGKTTLAVLLVRSMIGLGGDVLGYPVTECDRVLYLAMDRPAQIRRAMRRLFHTDELDVVNERLVMHPAPLSADLGKRPDLLLSLAEAVGANRIIVDSVKDAVAKVADDESGGNFNRAVQLCNAHGRPVAALHHQRKGQGGAKPDKLEDVYGSTWITAGAGSVVLLWGESGSGSAELLHLKTPSTPVGPLTIEIDTFAGTMDVHGRWDPLVWLSRRGDAGAQVADAARAMTNKEPTKASRDKARRRLDALVARGLATKSGGGDRNDPATYFAINGATR